MNFWNCLDKKENPEKKKITKPSEASESNSSSENEESDQEKKSLLKKKKKKKKNKKKKNSKRSDLSSLYVSFTHGCQLMNFNTYFNVLDLNIVKMIPKKDKLKDYLENLVLIQREYRRFRTVSSWEVTVTNL